MIEARYYIEAIEPNGARACIAGPFRSVGAGEEALEWAMRADPTVCPPDYLSQGTTRPRARLWRVAAWAGRGDAPPSWLGVSRHSATVRNLFGSTY